MRLGEIKQTTNNSSMIAKIDFLGLGAIYRQKTKIINQIY